MENIDIDAQRRAAIDRDRVPTPTDGDSEGAQSGIEDRLTLMMQQMASAAEDRHNQLVRDTQGLLAGLSTRIEQAGGAAQAAGNWAAAAGGAVDQMAQWQQQANAAAQQRFEEQMAAGVANPAPATQQVAPQASATPFNIKPPTPPKFRGAHKEPRILEWTHQAGQYLLSIGMAGSVQGVFHITSYLADDAATWWRLYCNRVERNEAPAVFNWWALRLVLLETFSEINRLTTIKDQFSSVQQTTSVQAYIAKFQSIVIELPEKSEADQVHQFLRGLKKGVQLHTRTHQPQTLAHAMRIADEADRAIYASGGGDKASFYVTDKKGGGSKSNGPSPMQVGAVSLSPDDKARALRDGLCFKCMKPGHAARECRSGTSRGGGRGRGRGRSSSSKN